MLGIKQRAFEHQRKTEGLKKRKKKQLLTSNQICRSVAGPFNSSSLIQPAQLLAEGEQRHHQTWIIFHKRHSCTVICSLEGEEPN